MGAAAPIICKMLDLILNRDWYSAVTPQNDLYELVDRYDVDFLCLIETWENKDKPIKFRDWKIFTRPRLGSSHGGNCHLWWIKFKNVKLRILSVGGLRLRAI